MVRVRELMLGLWLGLEEVFMFDSTSENRDRAVEAVESVSEARAVETLQIRVRVRVRVIRVRVSCLCLGA